MSNIRWVVFSIAAGLLLFMVLRFGIHLYKVHECNQRGGYYMPTVLSASNSFIPKYECAGGK